MTTSNNGYNAGYGSSPKSGQFKKGQSGNPKGRPKSSKAKPPLVLADLPTDRIFNEQLYSLVKARTADGVQEMPFSEALIKVMQGEALKGRRLVIKDLLIYMREQERLAAERAQEVSDMLEKIKIARQAVLDEAAAKHLPPPKMYPHPADIVLDRDSYRYTLIGPFDESETPFYDHWISTQRLFLIWSERVRRRGGDENDQTYHHFFLLAQDVNDQLPPSYQWSDFDWARALMNYSSMSKKALAKEEKAEAARNARDPRRLNTKVALPQRNINILNDIASALRESLDKAADHLEHGGALDVPYPTRQHKS